MILVMGTIKLAAGEIDRLNEALITMMMTTQVEDGCEQYVFSRDVTNPDHLLISERWRDEAALAAHGKTNHMKAFNAAIGSAEILSVSVKAYEVAGVRTLIGE